MHTSELFSISVILLALAACEGESPPPSRAVVQAVISSSLGKATAVNNPGYPRIEPNGEITLLPEDQAHASAALWALQKVNPPFEVEFEYSTKGSLSGIHADGFVVMFGKDNWAYDSPPLGGAHGFVADGTGYGVHFNTYLSPGVYLTDGSGRTLSGPVALQTVTAGQWHAVRISVSLSGVRVYQENKLVLSHTGSLPFAYPTLGFAAASGDCSGEDKLRNIRIWDY